MTLVLHGTSGAFTYFRYFRLNNHTLFSCSGYLDIRLHVFTFFLIPDASP